MSRYKKLLTAAALAGVLSWHAGCSAEPEETNARASEGTDAATQGVTERSTPAASLRGSSALQAEAEGLLRPLELRPHRYVAEMSQEEIEKASRTPQGEFIDPRKVIELLRKGPQEPAAQATDADNNDSVSGWRINNQVQEEALVQFDAGDLDAAVRSWENLLVDTRAWTISVEVDCDSSILRGSFDLLRPLNAPLFLLAVKIDERNCYRLCLGVFARREDASAWMKRIQLKLPNSVPFVLSISRNAR